MSRYHPYGGYDERPAHRGRGGGRGAMRGGGWSPSRRRYQHGPAAGPSQGGATADEPGSPASDPSFYAAETGYSGGADRQPHGPTRGGRSGWGARGRGAGVGALMGGERGRGGGGGGRGGGNGHTVVPSRPYSTQTTDVADYAANHQANGSFNSHEQPGHFDQHQVPSRYPHASPAPPPMWSPPIHYPQAPPTAPSPVAPLSYDYAYRGPPPSSSDTAYASYGGSPGLSAPLPSAPAAMTAASAAAPPSASYEGYSPRHADPPVAVASPYRPPPPSQQQQQPTSLEAPYRNRYTEYAPHASTPLYDERGGYAPTEPRSDLEQEQGYGQVPPLSVAPAPPAPVGAAAAPPSSTSASRYGDEHGWPREPAYEASSQFYSGTDDVERGSRPPPPYGGRPARHSRTDKDEKRIIEDRIGQERPCRTLFIRNINFETNTASVHERFAQFGEIKGVVDMVERRGIMFITFFDIRAADAARERLNGEAFGGRPIDVHFSLPREEEKKQRCDRDKNQGTLFTLLKQSTQRLDDDGIRRAFGRYGEVRSVRQDKTHANARYVEFYDSRGCQMAFDELHGTTHMGGVWDLKYAWDLAMVTPDDMQPQPSTPGRDWRGEAGPLPPATHAYRAEVAVENAGGGSAGVNRGWDRRKSSSDGEWNAHSGGVDGSDSAGAGLAVVPQSYPRFHERPRQHPIAARGSEGASPGSWGLPADLFPGTWVQPRPSVPTPPRPQPPPPTLHHLQHRHQPRTRSASFSSASSPPPHVPTSSNAYDYYGAPPAGSSPPALPPLPPPSAPNGQYYGDRAGVGPSPPPQSQPRPHSPPPTAHAGGYYGPVSGANIESSHLGPPLPAAPTSTSASAPVLATSESSRLEQTAKVRQLLASLKASRVAAAPLASASMPTLAPPAPETTSSTSPQPTTAASAAGTVLPANLAALLAQASAATAAATAAQPPHAQAQPRLPLTEAMMPPPATAPGQGQGQGQPLGSMQALLNLFSQTRQQQPQ